MVKIVFSTEDQSVGVRVFPPDITPMDFLNWGFLKDAAYKTKVNNLAKLRLKNTDAFQTTIGRRY